MQAHVGQNCHDRILRGGSAHKARHPTLHNLIDPVSLPPNRAAHSFAHAPIRIVSCLSLQGLFLEFHV